MGTPATAPKACTGLLTPPTSTRRARSKTFCERLCSFSAMLPTPKRSSLLMLDQEFSRELNALARLGPSRHVLGVIGQYDLRTGALNRRQNFQNNTLLLQPAIADCGFHHRVLAAYVVRTHRDVKAIPHLANYVEVRKPGFHHNNL